jgi:hypothetical protein
MKALSPGNTLLEPDFSGQHQNRIRELFVWDYQPAHSRFTAAQEMEGTLTGGHPSSTQPGPAKPIILKPSMSGRKQKDSKVTTKNGFPENAGKRKSALEENREASGITLKICGSVPGLLPGERFISGQTATANVAARDPLRTRTHHSWLLNGFIFREATTR